MKYKAIMAAVAALAISYPYPKYTHKFDLGNCSPKISVNSLEDISAQPSVTDKPSALPETPNRTEGAFFQETKRIPEKYQKALDQIVSDYASIVDVSKQEFIIYERNDGIWTLKNKYECSTGKNPGPKEARGDYKTPEGILRVQSIEPSNTWVRHGLRYGPWFCRAEHTTDGRYFPGIGIHGTNQEELLGSRASEGCIRLSNDVVEELVEEKVLSPGAYVVVLHEENISLPKREEQFQMTLKSSEDQNLQAMKIRQTQAVIEPAKAYLGHFDLLNKSLLVGKYEKYINLQPWYLTPEFVTIRRTRRQGGKV